MTEHQEPTKPKILIVEDEAIIALDLKSNLEQMGYTVMAQVNSGEKALEMVEQEPPDLVLMDIILKGKMDGIEAADIIRSRWDIPVVFCTAYADRDRLERAKLVYPFGYIIKPFQDNDLKITIEMALYISNVDKERRKAEEALQESEVWMKGIFNALEESVLVVTPDRKLININHATQKIFGYSNEEVLGQSTEILHLDHEHYLEFGRRIQDAFDKGKVANFEFEARKKSGEIFPTEHTVSLLKSEKGETKGIVSVIKDITERKRAEGEMRLLNRTYRVLSQANQALLHAVQESELLYEICRLVVEDGGYRMAWVGYAEQDSTKSVRPVGQAGFEEGYLNTVNITWADSERGRGPTGIAIRTGKPTLARNIPDDPNYGPWRESAIQRGYISSIALPLISNNVVLGTLNIYSEKPEAFSAEEISLLINLADNLAYGITSLRSFHERKRAEEALRDSEARYRSLFENSMDAIFLTDPSGPIFDANPAACRMFGRTKEEIKHLGRNGLVDVTDPQLFAALEERAGKGEARAEITMVRADGTKFPVEITSAIFIDNQQPRTSMIIRDISERKRAEENNHLMVEVLNLLNRLDGGETLIDELLRFIRQATGVEAIGLRLRRGQDFPYYFFDGLSESFVEKENFLRARDKDGNIICDAEGLPALECTCGLVLSRRADLNLPFFTKNGSFWTNESSKLLELKPEEDPRKNPRNTCIYEGYESIALIPLRADKEIIGLLHFNERKKGFFTIEMIQFLEDIADSVGIALYRKQVEDQIRASLKEKEVMVQEIHHRVKNNLQVIQSLLNLQAEKTKDSQSREVLKESRDRIRSMALIHEKLYRSTDFGNIDMADYLRDLSTRLFQSSQVNTEKVKLRIEVDEVQLGIDKAVPIGLILNELISNALKHAFPEGRGGEVNISMITAGDRYVLTVQDNGIGFPKAVDFQNTKSLGLELVNLLVGQINGTIDLTVEGGTKFTITIPMANHKG
ncbi:MAG: PAS domain S-box protein [Pseudomonadota bacterium]